MTTETLSRASIAEGLRRAIRDGDLAFAVVLLQDLPGLAGAHHLDALDEPVDEVHYLEVPQDPLQ